MNKYITEDIKILKIVTYSRKERTGWDRHGHKIYVNVPYSIVVILDHVNILHNKKAKLKRIKSIPSTTGNKPKQLNSNEYQTMA